jgi:hypothetical protein
MVVSRMLFVWILQPISINYSRQTLAGSNIDPYPMFGSEQGEPGFHRNATKSRKEEIRSRRRRSAREPKAARTPNLFNSKNTGTLRTI